MRSCSGCWIRTRVPAVWARLRWWPYHSPISQEHILFYNTLFDENASCHLALGQSYPNTLEGGVDNTREELAQRGGNDSINHVDFMVGTKDLRITGVDGSGSETVVFDNGDWAV